MPAPLAAGGTVSLSRASSFFLLGWLKRMAHVCQPVSADSRSYTLYVLYTYHMVGIMLIARGIGRLHPRREA
jgi:hypothetical protein